MKEIITSVCTLCFVEHYNVNSSNSNMLLANSSDFYLSFMLRHDITVTQPEFTLSVGYYLAAPASFTSMINAMLMKADNKSKELTRVFISELRAQGLSSNKLDKTFLSIENNL